MKVYHGTSKNNSASMLRNGLKKNIDTMNIDNQGYSLKIEAFFVTPNKDIAHIYECDNRSNGSLIVELTLNESSNILDLTNKENQDKIKQYIEENPQKTINDYLLENNFDGCKQYHLNDFGSKRVEYAITNINNLIIERVPKKETKFMSLYSEAMARDIDIQQYI